MSKKYSPSGYQIINITVPSGTQSGSRIMPTTEDEKALFNLLNYAPEPTKPILLTVYMEDDETYFKGVPSVYGSALSLNVVDTTGSLDKYISIFSDDEGLIVSFAI